MGFPPYGHREIERPDGNSAGSWFTYTCGSCGAKVSGAVVAAYKGIHWLICTDCGEGTVSDRQGRLSPPIMPGPVLEGLPPSIAGAYEEACRSLGIDAYTGTELLCRKILMHVAVEKGAKEGDTFAAYLAFLEKAGYVTPPMRRWVELIREHGNQATHRLDTPDKVRAESTLMFTAELLRLIYEMEHLATKYVGPAAASKG